MIPLNTIIPLNILGSIIIGTTVSLIKHPNDTMKTILQTDYNNNDSIFNRTKNLVNKKGIKSLYVGSTPRIAKTCGAFLICMNVVSFFENNM